jgi:hypothetical protein
MTQPTIARNSREGEAELVEGGDPGRGELPARSRFGTVRAAVGGPVDEAAVTFWSVCLACEMRPRFGVAECLEDAARVADALTTE